MKMPFGRRNWERRMDAELRFQQTGRLSRMSL